MVNKKEQNAVATKKPVLPRNQDPISLKSETSNQNGREGGSPKFKPQYNARIMESWDKQGEFRPCTNDRDEVDKYSK